MVGSLMPADQCVGSPNLLTSQGGTSKLTKHKKSLTVRAGYIVNLYSLFIYDHNQADILLIFYFLLIQDGVVDKKCC